MKFLINLEDRINQLLAILWEKISQHKIFKSLIYKIKSLITLLKNFILGLPSYGRKKRDDFLIKFDWLNKFITKVRGHIVGFLIYLRSEEFKKANKKELILDPIKKYLVNFFFKIKDHIKFNPIKSLSYLGIFLFFGVIAAVILKNSYTIFKGVSLSRHPANAESSIIHPITLDHLNFAAANNESLKLKIKIYPSSKSSELVLKKSQDKLSEQIKHHDLSSYSLPLSLKSIAKIEKLFKKSLKEYNIDDLKVFQVLKERPPYFGQEARMLKFENINFQLFLENVRRNRQVALDFTMISSNRNIVLFLKSKETEFRDHLNRYVEPIIPQLPINDEGRRIIKEKIKLEINDFLKKHHIEGKATEIYIDYIIVS